MRIEAFRRVEQTPTLDNYRICSSVSDIFLKKRLSNRRNKAIIIPDIFEGEETNMGVFAFMDSIPETKYLSAENCAAYRFIMRLFYLEYQKMSYQLDKETILSKLRREGGLLSYTPEQLGRDLDQLTQWKNLTAIQDPRKAYTIADFKNKRYQYMLTQRALEVERMTVQLEELATRAAGLSTNAFRQILEYLNQAESLESLTPREIDTWWSNLQREFEAMSRQYQDYLRRFYDPGPERSMKPLEFITYKRQLIRYLQEFIQELQHSAARIQARLESFPPEQERRILDLACQGEQARPNYMPSWEQEIRARNEAVWQSIRDWFIGSNSTARQVLEINDRVIEKVAREANALVQRQNMGGNKAEIHHIMTLFAKSPSLDDAHRLSAMVFGAQHARHFTVGAEREEFHSGASVYDAPPIECVLQPRTRVFKERRQRGGFADKSAQKAAQREKILQETQTLRQEVMSYIHDGKLDFSALCRPVTPAVRAVMLSWIQAASLDPNGRARTQYGQTYALRIRENRVCRLLCTDGILTMPDCVLIFDNAKEEKL